MQQNGDGLPVEVHYVWERKGRCFGFSIPIFCPVNTSFPYLYIQQYLQERHPFVDIFLSTPFENPYIRYSHMENNVCYVMLCSL